MVFRKLACWDPYSIYYTRLHFIPLYQNILAFVAISMQTTLKYTYLFLLNWLLRSAFYSIESSINDVFFVNDRKQTVGKS